MQYKRAYKFFGGLIVGLTGTLPFVSCTSTSNLSAFSSQNVKAVAKIAKEETAAESITANANPADTQQTAAGSPIAGAPIAGAPIAGAPIAGAPIAGAPIAGAPIAGAPVETITSAPVDQVAQVRPTPAIEPVTLASVPRTPVGNRPTNQIMMVRTTAYSHVEADHLTYGRKSAAGTTLQYGSSVRSAAADWSKYPMGTRFTIEGMPYEYVVDDYGSALVGTETIDIYKPEMNTMNKWGVRNVPIKVLEWGSFEESRKILDGRKHVRHADHVRKMLSEIEKKGRSGQIAPVGGGSA